MANFCIVALALPLLMAVSSDSLVSDIYTGFFGRLCRDVPINETEIGSQNSSSELVCEEQPHEEEINATVLEFRRTGNWAMLRPSLLSLLNNDSAAYIQLKSISTAERLYSWHIGACGYTRLMSLLLCAGLDVNRRGDYIGNEWFLGAAYRGLTNVVKMLLSQGVDINARDVTGFTALMASAHRGNIDLVRMLVEAGANTTFKNVFGETALQEAQAVDNAEVVEYLENLSHSCSRKYSCYYYLLMALCILITFVR